MGARDAAAMLGEILRGQKGRISVSPSLPLLLLQVYALIFLPAEVADGEVVGKPFTAVGAVVETEGRPINTETSAKEKKSFSFRSITSSETVWKCDE